MAQKCKHGWFTYLLGGSILERIFARYKSWRSAQRIGNYRK